MNACVLIFGAGDVALQIATGLAQDASVRRIVFAEKYPERAMDAAEMLANCSGCQVEVIGTDGTDPVAVTRLLRAVRADLIVQAASIVGPWQIFGIDHPVAHALSAGGIALQAPVQLPVLLNVMRCVRELGLDTPVTNLSMPDIAHVILGNLGLAPTIGLGNVSILHLRARAALRAKIGYPDAGPDVHKEPLLRLVGHHHHVYGVMQATPPTDPAQSVCVYVGDTGERDDSLAYAGHPFPTGPIYNVITAAASLPVIRSMLPEGGDMRFSAPAPFGLPGGYPVHIRHGEIALDLPEGVTQEGAVAFNERISVLDGVQAIDADGTLHYTDNARNSVAHIDPRLAEPLNVNNLTERMALFLETIGKIG